MKLTSLIEKQLSFRINESDDVYADLNRFRDQIELQEGPHTFKMLQSELMKGEEAFVENWLAEHGYIDRKPTPFEEEFLREQIRNAIKSHKTS
jgi:hypothetical protein